MTHEINRNTLNKFDLYNVLLSGNRSAMWLEIDWVMLGMMLMSMMSLEEGTVCMLAWFHFFRRRNIFRSVGAMSGDVLDHVSLEEQKRKLATLYFI